MNQIRYRKLEDRVKPLLCPVCNGQLLYDGDMGALKCINKDDKDANSCKFALTVNRSAGDWILFWERVHALNTDWPALGRLLKEIIRRRAKGLKLANNFAYKPRGMRVLETDELPDYLLRCNIKQEDFDYMRSSKCDVSTKELSQLFDMPEQRVEEIQNLEVR